MAYQRRTSPAAHEEQSDCEQLQAAEELCGDHQEGWQHWNPAQARKSLRLCLAGLRIRWFDPIAQTPELPDHSRRAPLFRLFGDGGAALCRMFNRGIRGQRWMPRYLSSDNDPLYRFHQWQANLRILEVTEIKSVPYVLRSKGVFGSHFVLDDSRSRKQAARFQDLL
jgi:hypothetical protein